MQNADQRYEEAKKFGVLDNIGKKVRAGFTSKCQSNKVAEVIGWAFDKLGKIVYYLRFENGEVVSVKSGEFSVNGYFFIN